MKGVLWLRPVFHHREDRIRSHIQLCWLALLCIRVVENGVGDSWRNVRHELDRMHLVTLETAEGRVDQRSATTPGQTKTLKAVELLRRYRAHSPRSDLLLEVLCAFQPSKSGQGHPVRSPATYGDIVSGGVHITETSDPWSGDAGPLRAPAIASGYRNARPACSSANTVLPNASSHRL
jgi:hypothetical protein